MLTEVGARRQACVFYASNDDYAIAALVSLERLRRLGLDQTTEIVLLHRGVRRPLLDLFAARGARLIEPPEIPLTRSFTYRYCLMKLRALLLTEYDRLVFLDADGLPMRPVEELLARTQELPLAAPRAYWLPAPLFSTMLLVVQPSAALREHAARALSTATTHEPDMDLLNRLFKDQVERLPEGTACLDSEFADVHGPFQFGDPESTYARTAYVHFSAAGKPWSQRPQRFRRSLPRAHPALHHLWTTWWEIRDAVAPEGAWDVLRRRGCHELGLARLGRLAGRAGLRLHDALRRA